ncbi:MAG: alpha-amylase family glycosyl hydrolase [Candidatus Hydrogenedentes bacterium]|nr:alpha-amylase family glycosyl hydrolase [Candidatus Hydrogenedentota bacterium]
MDYQRSTYFPFGFALRADVWDRYRVQDLVPKDDHAKPVDTRGVRTLAHRIQEAPITPNETPPPPTAGQMLTLGIVTEVLRFLIDYYCARQLPGVLNSAFEWTRKHEGEPIVDQPPPAFVTLYPPVEVQIGGADPAQFLQTRENDLTNVEASAREMMLLSLAMSNPAMRTFWPLFADDALRVRAPYVPLVVNIEQYFNTQPTLDLLDEPLFECLRAPMRAAPDSLEAQLDFIRTKWARILPDSLTIRLLTVQDILGEEYKQRGGFTPGGMVDVLRFGPKQGGTAADAYPEFERFSADADWMSNVVLMAKSVYVWLDQLSKKYQRHIHRLDHIPDEELDQLARWGFNGLWLIGLWERSEASATIKRMMGNPDAVSSAYSLFDYAIAGDLGGDDAYTNLRDRARARGIRLASDMVPNHMGMFSRWVIEHPHWFLSLPHPPYPNYTFNGPNLSHDSRVGLYIEDGYWTQRDAAVVFKRVDHDTGDTRYIYHGNDGTSMPWNDTAQLNYLMPEVREAVIQTILHVARKFPIIRFDAAMTLAKKHFQRLWFPRQGDSGAIPSRAEHGMGREEFDRAMPEEFWREVVDRVAREVPDTLLLAEAFWMMEGYFVRTLGMHRVYNSAFMNMLKMEQNANYRATVRNVLEFSPEILKRFVNFMNNPDERTAVEQFGKGDKYFGACLLMTTLPGLPMFGHGQIEGFTEKYGMEYRRAYWDEHADSDLVQRHEREIFPLVHKRYLFSGVEHFAFYDFHTSSGHVDENVFAYSNRAGSERSLVFYNNAYNTTSGWAKISTGLNTGRGEEGKIISKSLADSLNLRRDDTLYYAFRDHREDLEYIRHSKQLCDDGMFVHLNGYQWHAFIDWREIMDADGSWGALAWGLQGRGVHNLDYEHRDRELSAAIEAFGKYYNAAVLCDLLDESGDTRAEMVSGEALSAALAAILPALKEFAPDAATDRTLGSTYLGQCIKRHDIRATLSQLELDDEQARTFSMLEPWCASFTYWLLAALRASLNSEKADADYPQWLDVLHLSQRVEDTLREVLGDTDKAHNVHTLTRVLLRHARFDTVKGDKAILECVVLRAFDDPEAQAYLRFNEHEGIQYFNREQFENLIEGITEARSILDEKHLKAAIPFSGTPVETDAPLQLDWELLLCAADDAGYRIDLFREQLKNAIDAE